MQPKTVHLLTAFGLGAASLAAADNVFDQLLNKTDREECKSCVKTIIDDTCGGNTTSNGDFRECVCIGEGGRDWLDECHDTCCAGRVACQGQPYTDWWRRCVDEYPTPFCAIAPSSTGNYVARQHCTTEEIKAAESAVPEDDSLTEWIDRTFGNLDGNDNDNVDDGAIRPGAAAGGLVVLVGSIIASVFWIF